MSFLNKKSTFLGYRRENGRVGVRNHVIILPLDDLSNSAAEAVAISFMFDSWLPALAGFAVMGILIWQYEDAIRNPHPENKPINSPENTNS